MKSRIVDGLSIGKLDSLQSTASSNPQHTTRLDSWKDIATYLHRDVTTVRRWEKRESLPVHRHQHGALGSVYAFADEIDAWQIARDQPSRRETPPLIENRAPLFGRELELRRLHAHFDQVREGHRRIVFIAGELGIGKTALARAFLDTVRSDVWVVTGQCVEQYGRGEPYLPVIEGLERLIRDSRYPEANRIVQVHAQSWWDQRRRSLQGRGQHSVARPGVRRTDQMAAELIDSIEALAEAKPVIVQLEDLHWSDASTVELIARLGRRPDRARLLILGTYRLADLVDAGSPLLRVCRELRAHFQADEIELPLLTEEAIAQLIAHDRSWTNVHNTAARLRRWSGNPLFLLHLIEHLERAGSLRERSGAWALDSETLESPLVPPQLRTLVEDQVDRLGPETRRLLEIASVCGDPHAAALVAHVARQSVIEIERALEDLCRRTHLVRRREAPGLPDGTSSTSYAFMHEFYRQVVYDRLPSATSAELHREIGTRLEAVYGDRATEIASELATHFDRGHDAQRAVRHYASAAENAFTRHADREAQLALSRAAELVVQLSLDSERDRTARKLGRQFESVFTRLARLPWIKKGAHKVASPPPCKSRPSSFLLESLVRLSSIHAVSGDLQAAREIGDRAIVIGRVQHHGLFEAVVQQAVVRSLAGDFVAGRLLARDALETAEHEGVAQSDLERVRCWSVLAWSAFCLGLYEESRRALDSVLLAVDRDTGVAAATWAAPLLQWLGDRRLMTIDSTWLARVNGPVAEAPWATGAVHGRLLLHRRQLREGLEILQDSARTLRGLGMQSALPQTLAWLAEGFQMTGQFERARTTAEEGLDVIRRTGVRSSDPELYRLRGEAMLATRSAGDQHAGDRDGAEASFWAGITVARQQAARTLELRASVSLADLLLNSGRKDEARQILAPVCEAFAINVTSPDLVRARKVLRACM